ncbi:Dihydrolipoamide acyltransferase, partial [Giardia duodenalis]
VKEPPCRRETYFNRLLAHQLPDRAATHCLQMCGLLTDEERAARERHGSSWTATELPEDGMDQDHEARHDRLCLYLRLSREFNAELEVRRTATSDQSQKPDTWPSTSVRPQTGRHQPRQMDHCCNEKLKKHRDGTPDHLRDGRLSTQCPGGT